MTMTGGHKMKNRKIQEQLLIWFLIFTVIPLSVISFWCYLLASRIINQKFQFLCSRIHPAVV